MVKPDEKNLAIELRKKGCSYNEILKLVHVTKSTLSLWLRKVGLSKRQKQRLTRKKIEASKRGAQRQKNKRLQHTAEIKRIARAEIKYLNKRDLWLMGIMLYWAEGSKEKENGRGVAVQFSNSDPNMIKLFLNWLFEICKIPQSQIKYEIYIHENKKNRLTSVRKYWADVTGSKISDFRTIYFKKHKIKTRRKNIGKKYFGLLKIYVHKSVFLNRKIMGWVEGINQYYCRVV